MPPAAAEELPSGMSGPHDESTMRRRSIDQGVKDAFGNRGGDDEYPGGGLRGGLVGHLVSARLRLPAFDGDRLDGGQYR